MMGMSIDDLQGTALHFGGELLLVFAEDRRLVIAWDENAGWKHHFSVQARATTAFLPNTLRRLPAFLRGRRPALPVVANRRTGQ